MRGILTIVAVSLVLPTFGGCLSPPNIFHPGTEASQQARAQVYEPYPDNEIGPPVVGGRPRDYQEPRAEVTRALQRPGDPGLAVYPQSQIAQPPIQQAPIVTAPPAIYCPSATTPP